MVRLARLVEGMPLALELAAAWVRTVPCGDLVAAIDSARRRSPLGIATGPGAISTSRPW